MKYLLIYTATISFVLLSSLHCTQAEYFYSKIYEGSQAEKMTIIWVPSGFRSGRSQIFINKVDDVTSKMWDVNWFKDHREYFDVYRLDGDDGSEPVKIWDEEGKKKKPEELEKLITQLPNNWGSCNFLKSPTCKIFPSVIIDELSVAGGAAHRYFYIGRTAGVYEYPHEWGHEGFADCLCDEYEIGSGAAGAHWCRNLDDIPSYRKWADFILTQPFEGGNHRSLGIFRPSQDSIMRSPGKNPNFDALGYEAMNKGFGKRYGKIETRPPSISCNIQNGDVVSTDMVVRCDAEDESGIEMVIFYLARAGEFHQSFGFDKIAPYEAALDISKLEQGEYFLRCVVWDKNWNWRQWNPKFRVQHKNSTGLKDLAIPLNIQEVGKVGREQDIVSSGIPLPMGLLWEAENIRVVDSNGNTIPAQFKILERWVGAKEDQSIKWLLISFLGSVDAGGKVTYYLKSGKNSSSSAGLKIKETKDDYTIGGFKIKKDFSDPFKLIFTDSDEKRISAEQLTSINWEIVESGPVRVCLKAENSCDKDPFGFIAWLYFYDGLDRCDMTIVLKNTPRQLKGPLYFKDFSVVLNAPDSNYTIGIDSDKISIGKFEKSETACLYQESSGTERWDRLGEYDDWQSAYVMPWNTDKRELGKPRIKGYVLSKDNNPEARGERASGWASKGGVSIAVRHFWQQFPKAIEFSENEIIVRLWPKYWEGHGGYHWLDDMQRKSHDLSFRTGGFSEKDVIAFNHPLVIHCGLDWYRKTGVFGYIAEKYKEKSAKSKNMGRWEPGWVMFGGNYNDRIRRRYHDYPMTQFVQTGDPYYAYRTSIAMKHASAMTPFWIDNYAYPEDKALLKNICYCCPLREIGTYQEKTGHHGFMPWNPQHWMAGEIFDGWRLFGDPLTHDAADKMGKFLQFWVDYRKEKGITETRVDALPQNVLCDAYRVTGNFEFKKAIQAYVDIIWDTIDKDRGYYVPNKNEKNPEGFDKSFMLAYLAEGLNESYHIAQDERIIDMITGLTDYIIRESYIHPCYATLYETPVNLDALKQIRAEAKASLGSQCDCSAYKWGSDDWKACSSYRDWRILSVLALSYQYTKDSYYKKIFFDVYNGGLKKRGQFHNWNSLMDAILNEADNNPLPPENISDLDIKQTGVDSITLTWTAPRGAVRYQVKHSPRLIIPRGIEMEKKSDTIAWWAANNVSGEPLPEKHGTRQSMIIEGIEKGKHYFAIRSYSDTSCLSGLSNVKPITIAGLN